MLESLDTYCTSFSWSTDWHRYSTHPVEAFPTVGHILPLWKSSAVCRVLGTTARMLCPALWTGTSRPSAPSTGLIFLFRTCRLETIICHQDTTSSLAEMPFNTSPIYQSQGMYCPHLKTQYCQHWNSFSTRYFSAIVKYCKSDARYLTVGSYLDHGKNENIESGGCFNINLLQEPFSFPNPIESFAEKGSLAHSVNIVQDIQDSIDPYPTKYILIYLLDDLCQSSRVLAFVDTFSMKIWKSLLYAVC